MPLSDSDYDSILRAVTESERGRWFLREYAIRNRATDTDRLLHAIARIEAVLKERDTEQAPAAPAGWPPAGIPETIVRLRDIAERLIRSGASVDLCHDLLRRIEDLAAACVQSPDADSPDDAAKRREHDRQASAFARELFADIETLSPEEQTALFT